MIPFTFHGTSETGRVREQNEDCFGVDEEMGLFVVADGMGGHAAGEIAAQIAVQVLPRLLRDKVSEQPDGAAEISREAMLQNAMREVSERIRDAAQKPEFAGMGATCVALWVHPSTTKSTSEASITVAHLGDSRAYLWREGAFQRLTRDHSLVELMIESGDLTPQEAVNHSSRNQVTRFCGMDGEALPDVFETEVKNGDRFLLCTDGVVRELDHEKLALLMGVHEYSCAAQNIVAAAVEAGGRDNATALCLCFDAVFGTGAAVIDEGADVVDRLATKVESEGNRRKRTTLWTGD